MTWTIGLNAVVQKQLLRDKALTLRLSLNDILYHIRREMHIVAPFYSKTSAIFFVYNIP